MAKFAVTLMVPRVEEFEARDMQDAHNRVSDMIQRAVGAGEVVPEVREITEVDEPGDIPEKV